MEDGKTIEKLLNQLKGIEKNISYNQNFLTSMELLLTSENDGTVKDARFSEKFNILKDNINQIEKLTKEFITDLQNENWQ